MILGIDLGTTNSLVAVFTDGEPRLIPNAQGHFLTPSAVAVTDAGDVVVGLAARELSSGKRRPAATNFKRWMGSDKRIRLGSREFRPEELSAILLRALAADASAHLGYTVTDAVITVPAYFNDAQRRATKTAAELAGLNVKRLLNEPTAAGLAYGLEKKPDYTTFLVVDLGGGTFDVSIIEYFEGVVEVRASAGDTRLGGEDFADVIVEWMLAQATDLDDEARIALRAQRTLWRAAEQLKRDLTDSDSACATVRFAEPGPATDLVLTRAEFERLSAPLIQKLRHPIERALADARITPDDLSEIVLVGGATRMPMVRQLITRLFHRLPLRLINPDEVVARGAAVQAALCARDSALEEIVLTDVMPYSLGVATVHMVKGQIQGSNFVPVLERNMPVPVSRMKPFFTVYDNQPVLRIDVRQGESLIALENLHLGDLDLAVPPRPAGETPAEVRFSYDASGLLEVDVLDPLTGHRVSKEINQNSKDMGVDERMRAKERLAELKIHPRELQDNVYLVERGKRLFEERLGDEREWIAQNMLSFDSALETQDPQIVVRAKEAFKKVLDEMDKGFVL